MMRRNQNVTVVGEYKVTHDVAYVDPNSEVGRKGDELFLYVDHSVRGWRAFGAGICVTKITQDPIYGEWEW